MAPWGTHFALAPPARTTPREVTLEAFAKFKGCLKDAWMAVMVNFIVVLSDVLGISDPHVTYDTVRAEQSFSIGAGEKCLPMLQIGVKGRPKH